jgi:hypothetical protein
MVYVPATKSDDGVAKVIYTSKDRKSRKVFNALDWLAKLVTHIPGRYEHTVRYYGYFSNKSRGMRKKAEADDTIPTIMPNEMSSSEARHNWARLIQKIYEVDPLVCPKCQGQMKIISIIDDFEIINKILRVTFRLKHLDLWDIRNHDPPEIEPVYIPELTYVKNLDYANSGSQIPVFDTFWS